MDTFRFDPNRRYSSSHTLPDGSEVDVRYEYSQVVSCTAATRLPEGKTVTLHFDKNGSIAREEHSFGEIADLYLVRRLGQRAIEDEHYFFRARPISRKKYERLRADRPAMPPATAGAPDPVAELASLVAAEARSQRARAKRHVVNPDRGAKLDAFCREMLASGNPKDLSDWMLNPGSTLGERDRRASRALVDKLFKLGAPRAWACHVEDVDPGRQNSGQLIVQLPTDATQRKSLLRVLDRLAREQGFEGDQDDGQSFAYVKLD